MRLGYNGRRTEEAANYHTAPQALPRSFEVAEEVTRKRLIALLRAREPVPEAMQNLSLIFQESDLDAKIAAEVLQKLSEWLRRDSLATQQLCIKFKVHGPIVNCLVRHAGDIDVARAGLGVIGATAVQSSENASALTRGGVLLQIYKMMELHPRDRIVLDNAALALWRLADRGSAKQIVLTGGTEKMLKAMRANLHNPFVQSNGCLALQLFLELGGEQDVQGIRAVALQAIQAHKGNIPIRRSTDRLLRTCDVSTARGVRTQGNLLRAERKDGLGIHEPPAGLSPCAIAPRIPFRAWLDEVDDTGEGELGRYHRALCQTFDSLAHLMDAYSSGDGVATQEFFEDLGIRDCTHRQLFLKWFEGLSSRQGPASSTVASSWQQHQSQDISQVSTTEPSEVEAAPQVYDDSQGFEQDDLDPPDAGPEPLQRALQLLEFVGLGDRASCKRVGEHLERFLARTLTAMSSSSRQRPLARNVVEDGAWGAVQGSAEPDFTRACFNAALKVCEEGQKWEQALLLMEEMRRHSTPDTHSYAALIGACGAERQWAHALEAVRRMHEEGIIAKTLTYNAAMWSLEDCAAPWEQAIDIMRYMQDRGVKPSALTYTAAVNVLSKHGRWQETLALLEDMRTARITPDAGTYRAIRENDWGCDWPVERALHLLRAAGA
eukprot:CAMPEP_0183398028 /NCGR_PEP_ID=MMETSP0370-20130417/10985_1 /TAXON_ID=268820 /ORGANISM="Peridinium aciculiferum, Strain PAER-2" /LENGTH=661 /DNA_ID=CAMNT_0025578991 /DNA_START=94 /DNA_END=2079 /DNA_ORIENTATION=+